MVGAVIIVELLTLAELTTLAMLVGTISPGIVDGRTTVIAIGPIKSVVGMAELGLAVFTSSGGVEEAWIVIGVVSSGLLLVPVPLEVIAAEFSDMMRGDEVGDSVVTIEDACCETATSVGYTSTALEVIALDASLIIAEGSVMFEASGTLVVTTEDACSGTAISVDDAPTALEVIELDKSLVIAEGSVMFAASVILLTSDGTGAIGSVGSALVMTLDGEIAIEEAGSSDCCDSMPERIALVIEGISEDSSDKLEAASVGCEELIKDESGLDIGKLVASACEVSNCVGPTSAVSMNWKLVVGAGPSELTEVMSEPPSCVTGLVKGAGGGGISPSPSPGTVIAVHHIESSGLKTFGLGRFRSPAM